MSDYVDEQPDCAKKNYNNFLRIIFKHIAKIENRENCNFPNFQDSVWIL